MYRYKNIGFRPVDFEDLEDIRKNRNDSETLLFLGNVDLVNSEQQKNWWHSISKSKSQMWFCIIKEKYENVIGVLRFQNIDYQNRSVEIGLDIFPEYRGKGFGKLSYQMSIDYLFQHFNMHCIYLKVASFNEKAIILYEKIGFKKTGNIPESIYRNGKYWNNLIYYRINK